MLSLPMSPLLLRSPLQFAPLLCAAAMVSPSACSSNSPPPPDGYVSAWIGDGPFLGSAWPPSQVCQQTATNWLQIGSGPAASGSKPTTVAAGGQQNGASVGIACTVSPESGGFHVSVEATLPGQGTLTIAGHVDSSGGQNVSGIFLLQGTGRFAQSTCSIAFDGGQNLGVRSPQPPHPADNNAVAAGRIWGTIVCPDVAKNDQPESNPDGGAAVDRQCAGYADFLFENCQGQ